MHSTAVSLAVVGSGGAGVMTAGNLLLDAAARAGLYGVMTRSSGPQIRGGEAAAMLRLAAEPVDSQGDRFDVLLAIDWGNAERFSAELPMDAGSLAVGDPERGAMPEAIRALGPRPAELRLKQLAAGVEGGRANMVAVGALGTLIGLPAEAMRAAVSDTLSRKGEQAVAAGERAIRAGADAAAGLPAAARLDGRAPRRERRWSISGNEACGLGAVQGGVRFVAAYPITPATEMLEWLAPALDRVGGLLVQAEDELASINQIIGASFGGVPSLTATSGPGLALMTESLGLAVASETPVVVVDVMRAGPSTGIPTKSEQSDLNIALHGLHGDAPHVVLAPTSLADCLRTTRWAVHLAETLQTAVIVLTDQNLAQARAIIERPRDRVPAGGRLLAEQPDGRYQRYRASASGVSPMSIPGTPGGQYTADGLEHAPSGLPSSTAADHTTQLDKRARKLLGHDYGEHWLLEAGDPGADTAVITWGSCCGPVREAVHELRAQGRRLRLLAPRLLAPAQPARMAEALAGVQRALVVEQSHGAQFFRHLRAWYELPVRSTSLSLPGPLPIRPRDVREAIERLMDGAP